MGDQHIAQIQLLAQMDDGREVVIEVDIDDERRGHPSASGIERLFLCPGSWQAEQAAPAGEESAAASEGTLLHAVLAGESPISELTTDQEWVVRRCQSELHDLLKSLQFEVAGEIREERLWTTLPTFSGKPDYVAFDADHRFVVIDFKTGRGQVPSADRNHQLRALAVLVYRAFAAREVIAAIIQPRTSPPVTATSYDLESLAIAAQEIREAVEAANAPSPVRIPGEAQCRYCRAKGACPEARGTALQAVAMVEDSLQPIASDVEIFKLTGEDLGRLLQQIDYAEEIFDRIKILARAHLANGGTIPGYEMRPGGVKREIVNPQKAYDRMPEDTTPTEFINCCTVGITKLETLFKEKTGLRGKELKAAFAEKLGDAIALKTSAPSLAQGKGGPPA